MAKGDTVYSLFGLKTPQQVAAEERERAYRYMAGQRTGYEKAGAGLGLLLSGLFGDSEEMQRAKQGEEIVTGARREAREAREAKAAELSGFQQRLRQAGGRTTREGQPLINLSAEEKLAKDQEQYYNLYNTIADKLDAAGFATEAENARTKASEQLLGSLAIRKQLADIGYTEAKTAAEGRGKWSSVQNYIVPGSDTPMLGGVYNGQLAIYGPDGQPRPMPAGAQKQVTTTQPATTVATVSQAGIAMPFIKQDPLASELGADEQTALAGWMANEVQELLKQKETTDPNAAYLLALEKAKKQGLLRQEAPSTLLGFDVPFTGGPVFTLQANQVPQGAPNSQPEPTAEADPEGSVRRYVGDRVALFDKDKKFIRFVD